MFKFIVIIIGIFTLNGFVYAATPAETIPGPDPSTWIGSSITDYIRFGIGYNFTDYDDDLRDEDSWDSKGWFVRVTGKY